MTKSLFFSLLATPVLFATADINAIRAADPRNIANGRRIPALNYVDQPYVVVNAQGHWVCVATTGKGLEGQPGQHIISTVSENQGGDWSEPVAIEPDTGPEASWATPLITPGGRIYVFYVFNGEEVVTLPNSERRIRSDSHGWYVFRYSDDGGKSWSAQRYRVPIRTTAVDRRNPWRGEVCHFWSIDKPKVQDGTVYLAITKLGKFFMDDGEGWVIASQNLLTENDPDKIAFNLLPEGDQGIKNPALGSVQEEFNLVPTGGNALSAVFRTATGTMGVSYSRDNGVNWSKPEPMTYTPGGRVIKNPRACPKLFKTAGGKYLLWYHHHGGKSWSGRNPAFISGGTLGEDGIIRWSEPELLLFDPNPAIRISYPDLIEQDGQYWITETQKSIARVHRIDPSLLQGLWNQATLNTVCTNGLSLEKLDLGGVEAHPDVQKDFGTLTFGGFSVELQADLTGIGAGTTLINTMNDAGRGVRVSLAELASKPVMKIEISDGFRSTYWCTDPGALASAVNHAVFVCDFSAGIVMSIVNGIFCDGGETRTQGWGRLPGDFNSATGNYQATVAPSVKAVRLYNRPIRVSEAIGNFRSLQREQPRQ